MSVTLTDECAEAINGALYETGFEVLGNTEGGAVDWWTRGTKPRNMRVSVQRSSIAPYVIVTCEWPVLAPGGVFKGLTTFTVPCDGSVTREDAVNASTAVIVKVLELFRDILEGKGAASPDAIPAGATP